MNDSQRSHSDNSADKHENVSWLVQPGTIRLLWIVFIAVLALTVLAQLVIKIKGYFSLDQWFGFGAVYGFGACLAMVLFAKLLGFVLKRDEQYYVDRRNDEEDEA